MTNTDQKLIEVLRAPYQHSGKEATGWCEFQQLVGAARAAAERIEADAERIGELKHDRDALWRLLFDCSKESGSEYSEVDLDDAKQALARRDARVAADVLDDFVGWAVARCNDWHRRGGVVTTKDIYGEASRRAIEARREAEGGGI